jgi:hypothetical protein
MSAADNLSYYQLAMFMPAHQLADPEKTHHYDGHSSFIDPDGSRLALEKRTEAMVGAEYSAWTSAPPGGRTLYEAIQSEGVRVPLHMRFKPEVGKPSLRDGHHRVFAADAIDPKMEIPVTWSEDVKKGMK